MTPDIAHHLLVLTYVSLATIFAVVAMRTFATARASRRFGTGNGALVAEMAEIKTRLAAVETMLRDVG